MANMIDITGKLGLSARPTVVIGGESYAVNDSAKAMLQLMALIEDDMTKPTNIIKAYELLFDAPTRKRLDKLGLSFADFTELMRSAIELVGGGGAAGEAPTPAIR